MPYRSIPLVIGETYHIFNRGVESRPIFADRRDYQRFLETVLYYQKIGSNLKFSSLKNEQGIIRDENRKLVEILSYCLMSNHFHFLLRQLTENGIVSFMMKISNSYTRYFNTRHQRIGHLFQGPYKAKRIETDEQLIHISRYIHLNPLASYVTKDLRNYEWSSYHEYIGVRTKTICSTEEVLNSFSSKGDYEQFVMDQADYAKKLEMIKYLVFE
jgi:putative transposase